MLYSSDGTSWDCQITCFPIVGGDFTINFEPSCICTDGNKIYGIVRPLWIISTEDCVNWECVARFPQNDFFDAPYTIHYFNNQFVVFGDNGYYTTTNFSDWQSYPYSNGYGSIANLPLQQWNASSIISIDPGWYWSYMETDMVLAGSQDPVYYPTMIVGPSNTVQQLSYSTGVVVGLIAGAKNRMFIDPLQLNVIYSAGPAPTPTPSPTPLTIYFVLNHSDFLQVGGGTYTFAGVGDDRLPPPTSPDYGGNIYPLQNIYFTTDSTNGYSGYWSYTYSGSGSDLIDSNGLFHSKDDNGDGTSGYVDLTNTYVAEESPSTMWVCCSGNQCVDTPGPGEIGYSYYETSVTHLLLQGTFSIYYHLNGNTYGPLTLVVGMDEVYIFHCY